VDADKIFTQADIDLAVNKAVADKVAPEVATDKVALKTNGPTNIDIENAMFEKLSLRFDKRKADTEYISGMKPLPVKPDTGEAKKIKTKLMLKTFKF